LLHSVMWLSLMRLRFFLQADDGIRDFHVTGVQTCALPIYNREVIFAMTYLDGENGQPLSTDFLPYFGVTGVSSRGNENIFPTWRSEERRVGKECRSRWSRCRCKRRGEAWI